MTDVVTREQVMNALLALLQRQCGSTFATYSRRFMTWEQVVNSYQAETVLSLKQPALFLYDGVGFGGGVDKFEQGSGRGTPAIVTMSRSIVIYARMPGPARRRAWSRTSPAARSTTLCSSRSSPRSAPTRRSTPARGC
jgi:hypothetical protein